MLTLRNAFSIFVGNGDVMYLSDIKSCIALGTPKLPSGRKFLPSRSKFLPSGRKFLPSGSKFLPSGRKFLPSGRKMLQHTMNFV